MESQGASSYTRRLTGVITPSVFGSRSLFSCVRAAREWSGGGRQERRRDEQAGEAGRGAQLRPMHLVRRQVELRGLHTQPQGHLPVRVSTAGASASVERRGDCVCDRRGGGEAARR